MSQHQAVLNHSRAVHGGPNDSRTDSLSTGPLACPFARLLAPLTRSLAPDCSLRLCPLLHSLVCSLTHFAHSLACGTVNDLMAIYTVFFSILAHGAPPFLRIDLGET